MRRNPLASEQASYNLSLSFIHLQHMAVGKHNFACVPSGKPNRRSILGWRKSNRDLVSRLERGSVPAISMQNAWTLRFNSPIHDFPFFIFDVKKNLDMRVGPHDLRHSSRNSDGMNFVVSDISMMRQERTAKRQKSHDQGERRYQPRLHISPRGFKLFLWTPNQPVPNWPVKRSSQNWSQHPWRLESMCGIVPLDSPAFKYRVGNCRAPAQPRDMIL